MEPEGSGTNETSAPEAADTGGAREALIRWRCRSTRALLVLAIAAITLLSVEGFASLLFLAAETKAQPIRAERVHTEFDPLLGWINRPNVCVRDLYGPGKDLRTNSQRFRNDRDFPPAVPPGRRRWICCGDSFTLGYGVDGEHSWSAVLGARLPRVECVNMGQGGYGVDQAFLWYQRDGMKLEHQVLVFAFISWDFYRMVGADGDDYPRPSLEVVDGQIIVTNTPLVKPSFMARRLPRYRRAIRELRASWLVRQCLTERAPDSPASPVHTRSRYLEELTAAIFSTLHGFSQKSGRTVLLVHLPTEKDHAPAGPDRLRAFLRALARSHGWFYLDLIDDFRRVPPRSVRTLFIQDDLPGFIASRGHYTEEGNRYIAELILKRIASDPSLARAVGLAPEAGTRP